MGCGWNNGGGAMEDEIERERQTKRQLERKRNVERERVRRQILLGLEISLECNK